MINTPWSFFALMLLCAGLFPVLAAHRPWRIFNVLPPIVLSYLLVTTLAISGVWQLNDSLIASQKLLMAQLLPALMFLLLIHCDLRAILALGPRLLAIFVCATTTLMIGFVMAYLLLRHQLPANGWQGLAAINGGWIGGTANLVAVSQALGSGDSLLANALLTDALCYSLWVLVLFSTAPFAATFNRWTKARASNEVIDAIAASHSPVNTPAIAAGPGHTLIWLGIALMAGRAAQMLAEYLPATGVLTTTSWTLLIATLIGLLAAQLPMRKLPGAASTASGLLALVVVAMASQGNFTGLTTAPWFLLAGVIVLVIHASLMVLAARIFHFDLAACGIASLANVGGVASTPLLAATYAPVLAPVGVLLAMLGYLLGTGGGLLMASILSGFAP